MLSLIVGALGLGGLGGDRLLERKLDDVAVIELPARVGESMYAGAHTEDTDRLAYYFGDTYTWASIGSGPAYRQLLVVSLMSPDASEADYRRLPSSFRLSYDPSHRVPPASLGSGTLEVHAGRYRQNTLAEPSHTYLYRDRTRRLQIAWHSVDEDVKPDKARQLIERMAGSFRVLREPAEAFAEMRDRPRREAEERVEKVRWARAALARAGFVDLEPGRPQRRDGVYAEWTDDPEPRLQLLKPLGTLRIAADTPPARYPRPRPGIAATGSVGWREHWEGEWRFHNHDNDYLPLPGIAAWLASGQSDENTIQFFYSVTVRVEESSREWIESLGGFHAHWPEVERAWSEGRLVPPR